MTTSPPDLSQLSLNNQQRPNDTYDYDGSRSQYHYATSPGLPVQSQYNPLTSSSPLKKPARSGLPSVSDSSSLFGQPMTNSAQQWMDSPGAAPDNRSLSPQNNSDFSSGGGSPPMGSFQPPIAPGTPNPLADDEIIPTAIVIKNIPFNVKRETLLDIIVRIRLIFHFIILSLTVVPRLPCRSLLLTRSTTISTSRALSVDWLLPISVRP
jgi:hypothetical protein